MPIGAHKSSEWKDKDLSNVQFGVVSAIEKTMDWSFVSAYKGTIGPLNDALTSIPAEFTISEDLMARLTNGITDESFAATVRRDVPSV